METTVRSGVYNEPHELSDYLQECVEDAGKIISSYWPISTFIANNGLANLENQSFAEALKYAGQVRGIQGFLPLADYRKFFAQGRITSNNLEAAISSFLAELDLPEVVKLGENTVSTAWLYQSWLLQNKAPEEIKKQSPELWESILRRFTLLNLLDTPTEQASFATETFGERKQANDGKTLTEIVNQHMITWCAAFLDEGQATWTMPAREQGFYRCWKGLAGYDKSLRRYTKQKISKKTQALPDEAKQALILLLQHLELPQDAWADYLTRHLAQLPGWASAIRWRQEHPEVAAQQRYPINLIEYLAVRLFYETLLLETGQFKVISRKDSPAPQAGATRLKEEYNAANLAHLVWLSETLQLTPAIVEVFSGETLATIALLAKSCTEENQQGIWQEAYEGHYRQQLLGKLRATPIKPGSPAIPEVQAVFCIDVRSEGFRRNLEKQGAYETFGFAGFFGVPMLFQPLGSSCNMTVAPALLTPTQVIREVPKTDDTTLVQRRLAANTQSYTWREVLHSLRENVLTPFAYVEMVGWFSFFPLLGKTLAPGGWKKLHKLVQSRLTPAVPTKLSIIDNPQEMSFEAQADSVAGMLRSIGLTRNFARLVLLCGHGSETENNPYASALDCGACGGNHGGASAFVAASILNSIQIRKLLAAQGINIPSETFFLAGEHNTTTDGVSLWNEDEVPQSHQAEVADFKQALKSAGEHNSSERRKQLPGENVTNQSATRTEQRAADWAQVRAEWGLVRNAAFICGSRSLTANLNLDNRVFLHSYDQNQDPQGSILEGILTAPVVVAEWINMQYYLSTVDNQHFGSSTKLLHTVVGQIGVMQGRQGDLLVGLPQQSVMVGDQPYHEPMRLCVIVEAPPSRISNIIARHERLQELTRNKWITLVAYDTMAQTFYQYSSNDEWNKMELDIPFEEEKAA